MPCLVSPTRLARGGLEWAWAILCHLLTPVPLHVPASMKAPPPQFPPSELSALVPQGPILLLDGGTHPPYIPYGHHLPKYNSMASMDWYFFTTRWLSMPSPCTMGSTFSAKCNGRSVERPHHCHWVHTAQCHQGQAHGHTSPTLLTIHEHHNTP